MQDCDFLPSGSIYIYNKLLDTDEYPTSKMVPFSEEAEKGIPDMVDLDKLNNATLLYNLKKRYYNPLKDIYTYVTPSLLSLNPFKPVPHLMTQEILNKCKEVKITLFI